jgi:hypothetical protein
LLILLDKSARTMNDYDNYAYPFAELGWTYGKHFSAKIFTVSEWENKNFLSSIKMLNPKE